MTDQEQPRSAERIAADMRREAAEKAQRDGMVSALLREREGYVNRRDSADDEKLADRMTARIAAVDESLRYHDAGDRIPKDAKPRRGASKTAAPDASADPSKTA